jgi:hypothetical protein
MARRLLGDAARDESGRIQRAHLLALGRYATETEATRAATFLAEYRHSLEQGAYRGDAQQAAWSSLCQTLIASAEFRYLY